MKIYTYFEYGLSDVVRVDGSLGPWLIVQQHDLPSGVLYDVKRYDITFTTAPEYILGLW